MCPDDPLWEIGVLNGPEADHALLAIPLRVSKFWLFLTVQVIQKLKPFKGTSWGVGMRIFLGESIIGGKGAIRLVSHMRAIGIAATNISRQISFEISLSVACNGGVFIIACVVRIGLIGVLVDVIFWLEGLGVEEGAFRAVAYSEEVVVLFVEV